MPSLWVTGPDGALLPLDAEGHASEKDFQKVLADNPAVLAGALAQGEESWLLIDRELPIKAQELDTGTWKLDLTRSTYKPGPAPKSVTVMVALTNPARLKESL